MATVSEEPLNEFKKRDLVAIIIRLQNLTDSLNHIYDIFSQNLINLES